MIKNYDVEIFALKTSLEDEIIYKGCTYNTIINWLNDIYDDKYTLAVAMVAKSTLINVDNRRELVLPDEESITAHLHIIEGAIASKKINLREYNNGSYRKINLFTGEIIDLGKDKTNWTWFN